MKHHRIALVLGLAVLAIGGSALADDDLSLDDLPTPVRATAEREVGSGIIDEIEWDAGPDGGVFEVEFTLDAQEWELHIAEDGTLLRRALD